MSNYKFQVRALFKSYKNGTGRLDVLKGIDLAVGEKEFLVIAGPSGAGKSTLLHILGGLDNPTEGEVLFDGVSIRDLKEKERAVFRNRKIGFVFQFYYLLPELNVLENVLLPGLLKSWGEKKEAAARARAVLDNLGLSGRLTHRPNQLSGGEQQRAAIARALINKPEVLLCDEPTGNLDSENGEKILALLKRLNIQEGMTIVMVTHDQEIAKTAERSIYLKDGMLVS
ncbi:ABC transporter ATP-binding protein [bacterium]|nr:MAG: ABC transporter ATP-binding protein [bacterium]